MFVESRLQAYVGGGGRTWNFSKYVEGYIGGNLGIFLCPRACRGKAHSHMGEESSEFFQVPESK